MTDPTTTESTAESTAESTTGTTEILDEMGLGPAESPETTPEPERMPRPRIRYGALVWGLIVTVVSAITLIVATDPEKSREFITWIDGLSEPAIGLIALIALGGLILLLGLVSLLRQTQRRDERS